MSAHTPILFKNALIVSQNTDRQVYAGHVLVNSSRIQKISKKPITKLPKKTKVMDLKGKVLMPGLIQTHVHLCQTLFRNQADDLELLDWLAQRIWPFEAAHNEETLALSAELGIHELLSTGTTTLLDMGTVRHTNVLIETLQKSGIRASVGKCLMDHPELTPVYLRESTEAALRETADFLTQFGKNDQRVRYSLAPRFALSCTSELLQEVARLSKQHSCIVHTHASENRSEIELVRKYFGCENVEYLQKLGLTHERLVLAHGIWLNDTEKKILARSQSTITHCPSSNLKLASGIADIVALKKAGVRVALGADGAPCNNNLNAFTEMRLAALLQKPGHGPKAVRAQEALDLATLNGAEALQIAHETGSIEEGKKADLICLDLDRPECMPYDAQTAVSAIVYSSGRQNLEFTMVDGEILYQSGVVKGISTRSIQNRIQKLWPKHQTRANRLLKP